MKNTTEIAEGVWNAIRNYRHHLREEGSKELWDWLEPEQRESFTRDVQKVIDDPNATAASAHESWRARKAEAGYVLGENDDSQVIVSTKDGRPLDATQYRVRKPTHSAMLPFDQLPTAQRAAAEIFFWTIRGLTGSRGEVDRKERTDR